MINEKTNEKQSTQRVNRNFDVFFLFRHQIITVEIPTSIRRRKSVEKRENISTSKMSAVYNIQPEFPLLGILTN